MSALPFSLLTELAPIENAVRSVQSDCAEPGVLCSTRTNAAASMAKSLLRMVSPRLDGWCARKSSGQRAARNQKRPSVAVELQRARVTATVRAHHIDGAVEP